MHIFALFSLLASLVTLLLGTFVLYRNTKGAINWMFFLYSFAGSLAAFAEFGYRQAETLARAALWIQLAFFWIFAIPLELHFMLYFTERQALLKKRWTYVLLYAPAVIFVILWVAGIIPLTPVRVYWGWTYARAENLFLALLGMYVGVVSLYELVLCAEYYLFKARRQKRRQAGLILAGMAFTLSLVLISEPGWMFTFFKIQLPRLTAVGFVVESILLTYAIWKYHLFPLTSSSAADSIISTLADALLLVTPDGKIATVNRTTLALLDYTQEELLGMSIDQVFTVAEVEQHGQIWHEQIFLAGTLLDIETTFQGREGKEVAVSLSIALVYNDQGEVQGVSYVARDLTERKLAEDKIKASLFEKEVLLKEIHHRVKNNLQVISSLLMLQSDSVGDERVSAALNESRNRVYSMAVIHETLYQSENLARVDFAKYTQKLIDYLLLSYSVDQQSIVLNVNIIDISLSIDLSIYCGLIINELLSNAFKYAFPDGQKGEISIDLSYAADRQLLLTIADNGVGLPPDLEIDKNESLGLQLVSMLAEQVQGQLSIERELGTTYRLLFSVDPADPVG